ncbi:ATP-dependent DNA ligase [Streptomyces sp. HNM0663]|uniref:ATP-dependent DNA ligase n=1 Tax=Streptomyces chengmaiensis TaxID=3040919 RepID=A0ABT6HJ28_9ACTN|nr:ATP-dependent DNA ligase [Streptomyces chengmaiensis]MDH2388581.1 ATP-dependent DNA ligase [Streptomyces chengmaiensis]
MVLKPPVEPMLAQARETVPAPGVLPGNLAFEAKFDGYRALLFTPARPGGPTLLQSRRGSLIQRHFPDLVTAAHQLPHGLVLDGEVVVWSQGRLSFEALQRRASSGGRTVAQLADAMPARFITFDVLQIDGQELLAQPYERRRAVLEGLFRERGLSPPWTLCPMTTDPAVAQEWLTSWTKVQGVEGLVIKGLGQRYLPGARGWFKVRRRDTTEAIVGGVTGTLRRPQILVLGRYDEDGRLRAVGRTTPLKPDTAAGAAANPSTRSSSSPTWSRKSARIPPSIEARGDTHCASSGRAWTSPWPTCRCSGKAYGRPAADPAAVRDGCAKGCSGPLTGHFRGPVPAPEVLPPIRLLLVSPGQPQWTASADLRSSAGRCGGLSEGGPGGPALVDVLWGSFILSVCP